MSIGSRKLGVYKGSEIEISSEIYQFHSGNASYSAILEEDLGLTMNDKVRVRYLDPLLKQDFSPPIIRTIRQGLIRRVPPPDPSPDVGFEVGDVIDAVHNGGWYAGKVIKVLKNRRYLVYLDYKPGAMLVERKHLRPHIHWIWSTGEYFRSKKRSIMKPLIEPDFSPGNSLEARTEEGDMGDVWSPGFAKKDNQDGTLLVKISGWRYDKSKDRKISLPYSKIRPSPSHSCCLHYKLMEKVDVHLESGWCPGIVTQLPHPNQNPYNYHYVVVLGPNKEGKKFDWRQLRPSLVWRDGLWLKVIEGSDSEQSPYEAIETSLVWLDGLWVKGSDSEQSPHEAIETPKRETHSSGAGAMENPPPSSSNGVDVSKTGKLSVTEIETEVPDAATHLTVELESQLANAVIKKATPVTRQPVIGITKGFHSSVVLGNTAATLTTPVVKTRGKTYLRKKLRGMKNQKGSANDSVGEKESEKTKNRETLRKRKRGQPHNLISTEPKQKTGMLNSFVEKRDDFVETPPSKEPIIILPFAKKSPVWKVFESMEVFKIAPQYPHFSPLLERGEEFREADAVGSMVMYTGLLEKLNNLQVDDPISDFNKIDECFLDLEKHGFNITKARSRIAKLLSIKERQTWTREKLDAFNEKITESDSKRRKCEEDIVELQIEFQRREAELKEEKVRLDKEIGQMQSHAAVLDQEAQNVDQGFRTIAAAPLL